MNTNDNRLDIAPTLVLYLGAGQVVSEAQVLVGTIKAPVYARATLASYSIRMDDAVFCQTERLWKRCLFSEELANALVELSMEGQFPFDFEACPSKAYLEVLSATDESPPKAPPTEEDWLTPATLEALNQAIAQKLISSSWLRRSRPREKPPERRKRGRPTI